MVRDFTPETGDNFNSHLYIKRLEVAHAVPCTVNLTELRFGYQKWEPRKARQFPEHSLVIA